VTHFSATQLIVPTVITMFHPVVETIANVLMVFLDGTVAPLADSLINLSMLAMRRTLPFAPLQL
jgi:hypothetical protein